MAYFSNGCEGDVLDEQCANCPLGYGWNDPDQTTLFDTEPEPRPCPVALVQLTYNYDQLKKGNERLREAMEMLINADGVCLVRAELVQIRKA